MKKKESSNSLWWIAKKTTHANQKTLKEKENSPIHSAIFIAQQSGVSSVRCNRIIKTKYLLRYITDPDLHRSVQRQLYKGEYQHKLPRRIFFADQGEFTSGAYMDIMNKASCLSLVSNAVLYWNTKKTNTIVEDLRNRQEEISDETLSHISLLPYKHIIPNGTYFIEDYAHTPTTWISNVLM